MTKYDAYKDSGVKWLGDIPEDWQVVRLKYVLEERNERSKTGDEPLLMVSQVHGLVVRSEFHSKAEVSASNVDNKIVHENDLVFNKLKAHLGVFFKSNLKFKGLVSPDYAVYKAKGHIDDLKLLELLFRNPVYIKQFIIRATGVAEGLIRLYTSDLFDIPVPIAPKGEQAKILSFLDKKTTQIDEAIATKEQQITLLKERKQIIIQKAVTQGLDPNVPMKNSGVEWIGKVPEHWSILANRALFSERVEPGRDGLPLLSVSIHSGVSTEEISDEDNIRGRVKIEDKSKYILVQGGDVAFNMMRAWQGGIGAVKTDGMVSPAYIVAKANSKISAEYFEYQYRCPEFIQQMDRYSKGITDFRKRLYWDSFKQLITVVPPIDEQLGIIEHIQQVDEKIGEAIKLFEQQIQKLKEYKTTLINSAVTGKIKVTPEMAEPAHA